MCGNQRVGFKPTPSIYLPPEIYGGVGQKTLRVSSRHKVHPTFRRSILSYLERVKLSYIAWLLAAIVLLSDYPTERGVICKSCEK